MQTETPDALEEDVELESETDEQDTPVAPSAEQESSQREKELRDRLAAQGRELAETKRTAQQLAEQLATTMAKVELIGQNVSARQQEEEERKRREQQAYLDSLPEPQRLREELRLANERLERLERGQSSGRNGEAQPQTSGSRQPQTQTETPQDYQTRRMREIINDAQESFGVSLLRADLEAIPEQDWEDERTFQRAVFATAARKQAQPAQEPNEETDVAGKPAAKGKAAAQAAPQETQAEMEERIRRSVLREMGVQTPASPRAAGVRRSGPAPTEQDVREAAGSYDSRRGPKENIKRLLEVQRRLGI